MASDIYLKLGSVKGESADSGHKDEIDVLSFSWGANNPSSMGVAGGGGVGKGTPSEVTFTHYVDKASPNLFKACANGEHFKGDVQLTVRKAGKEQQEYLVFKLEQVFVTSVSLDASRSDEVPMENVSLAFGKIEMEYKEQKEDGTLGGGVKMGWDVKANKVT
jgi:type VI secretion system secreted protein Hcp